MQTAQQKKQLCAQALCLPEATRALPNKLQQQHLAVPSWACARCCAHIFPSCRVCGDRASPPSLRFPLRRASQTLRSHCVGGITAPARLMSSAVWALPFHPAASTVHAFLELFCNSASGWFTLLVSLSISISSVGGDGAFHVLGVNLGRHSGGVGWHIVAIVTASRRLLADVPYPLFSIDSYVHNIVHDPLELNPSRALFTLMRGALAPRLSSLSYVICDGAPHIDLVAEAFPLA